LTTSQGVRLDRCEACRGLWLDKGEINFFTAEWEYLRDYALNRSHSTDLPCPSCGARLEEGLWTSADLKVDKCPACGGLFFEAGELAGVGRLHAGLEHSLSERQKVDWLAFPRLYILAGAVLTAAIAAISLLVSLFSASGVSAASLAVLGLAALVVAACRFTGNELGDASCRALRGLDLPMAVVPQRVALTGSLRCGPDQIVLVDATGSVPIWTRIAVPPFPQLDALWVPRVRALAPDATVRVIGWYRAWPFHHFLPVSIHPRGAGPGSDIRSATSVGTFWGAVGGGALLLLLAVLLPVARHEAALEWSLAREQVSMDAESWLRLGIHAAWNARHPEARELLGKAIAADLPGPEDDRVVAEAQYNLGLVFLLEGKRDEAQEAFRAAIDQDPRCPWAREALDLIESGTPFGLPGLRGKVYDAK